MTGIAQGLPVGAVPEQRLISLVWLDMIDKRCRCTAAAAEWIAGEIFFPLALPFLGVTTLAGGWSLLVELSFARLVTRGPFGAALTMSMDTTTLTANARRANRHVRPPAR